jgi:SAM-dependent methyltransferase
MIERINPADPIWNRVIAEHIQRYRFAARFVSGMRVLDAGCGVGYGSKLLIDSGAAEVLAVDISREALDIAEKSFGNERLKFLCGDCETLTGVSGTFDVIVALEALEHFREDRRFLSRAADLLAEDGVLIVSTPNRSFAVGGNPYHVREYTAQEFGQLLRAHFKHVTLVGQHWTAAYRAAHQAASALWTNPFMRLGRLLEVLRGRKVDWPLRNVIPTEADLVISELYPDTAWTLLAVCANSESRQDYRWGSCTCTQFVS